MGTPSLFPLNYGSSSHGIFSNPVLFLTSSNPPSLIWVPSSCQSASEIYDRLHFSLSPFWMCYLLGLTLPPSTWSPCHAWDFHLLLILWPPYCKLPYQEGITVFFLLGACCSVLGITIVYKCLSKPYQLLIQESKYHAHPPPTQHDQLPCMASLNIFKTKSFLIGWLD